MTLRPGSMLTPTLRLDRELGRGAMGAVWVATNTALGSQVAVKVLKDSGESKERFAQEARGLAQIDSPHVVQIFDFGTTSEGEPFIVMELLKGRDLRSHIERGGALALDETKRIITQLCHALTAAHERRIVHRDIKPANIFISDVAGEVFVQVLDFGVAKFLGTDLGMTSTGALMGTPYYASPEQLLTPRDVDHRTDLWSVAVVTYACLTGALPFVAETLAALSIKINAAEFAPATGARPQLPPAVDAWMSKALARKPADRFASASELSAALVTALDAPARRAAPPATEMLPMSTIVLEPEQAPTLGASLVASPAQSATPAPDASAAPTSVMPPVAAVPVATMMAGPLGQSTLSPTSSPGVPLAPAPPPARANSLALPVIALVAVVGLVGVVFLLLRSTDAADVSTPVTAASAEPTPALSAEPQADADAQESPDETTTTASEPTTPAASSAPAPAAKPPPKPVTPPPSQSKITPPPPATPPPAENKNPFGTRH